jgi:sucrose phosphorylase
MNKPGSIQLEGITSNHPASGRGKAMQDSSGEMSKMDVTREGSSRRIFCDPEPDYTRSRLEIPEEAGERMFRRLRALYGEPVAKEYLPELERIMRVHHAHRPPELVQQDENFDPNERFTERDLVLITYGDLLAAGELSPLATLAHFLERPKMRGIFNTIHLLPFFPYSSDRGFSVKSFKQVDPRLGSWDDIAEIGKDYQLMFDGVLNHASAQTWQFREVLNGHPWWKNMVITYSSPDELPPEQRRIIRRPRTSDVLTKFDAIDGPIWVWTTFSPDQIDLNYHNPDVLMNSVGTLLLYVRRGADIIRLDAVTYLWAELGTTCASLEQTHEIIKLFRDVLGVVAPRAALLTETNVPHDENISYFGNGHDEAHMVYNFALPPMVLHTFYSGDATALSNWVRHLEYPSETTTYLNILDTHDGIGVLGVQGILAQDQIDVMIRKAREHGAFISYRTGEDGTEKPYEINSTWYSAVNRKESSEDLRLQLRRFAASRSVALVLKGVPGMYFHGVIGTENDPEIVEKTGSKRDVNRQEVDVAWLDEQLKDPHAKLSLLRNEMSRVAEVRNPERAFHPGGEQHVLELSPSVFSLLRVAPEGDQRVVALINVANKVCSVEVLLSELGTEEPRWLDLVSEVEYVAEDGKIPVNLQPYDVIFLKAKPG